MSEFEKFWGSLGSVGKVGLIATLIAVVLAPVLAVSLLHQNKMGLLYSGLEPADAAEVKSKLENMKVQYELSSDGTNILVDAEQVADVRLSLLNEGYQQGGGNGFEIFDQSSYAMSDFTQRINFQRALQGELQRTIGQLKEVKSSRVHLVLPESRLFEKDKNHAKASVVIVLKRNKFLSASQIEGIQNLVSSSVEGLDPSNVIVSDDHGLVLSNAIKSQSNQAAMMLSEKSKIESYLEQKCLSILEHAFGKGQSVVNVNVSLATSEVHETRETVVASDDDNHGLLTKSKTSVTKRMESEKSRNSGKYQVVQENTENQYAVGKVVESSVRRPGDVERVSLSALLPPSVTNSELESIRDLLSTAVGIVEARGDTLAVERLSRYREPLEIDSTDTVVSSAVSGLKEERPLMTYVADYVLDNWAYLIIALVILVVVIIGISITGRKEYQLDNIEKQQLLLEIQDWLKDDTATAKDRA